MKNRIRLAAAGLTVTLGFGSPDVWAVLDSAQAPAGPDLKVVRVVPEGNMVPLAGKQIVVTFDRPSPPWERRLMLPDLWSTSFRLSIANGTGWTHALSPVN